MRQKTTSKRNRARALIASSMSVVLFISGCASTSNDETTSSTIAEHTVHNSSELLTETAQSSAIPEKTEKTASAFDSSYYTPDPDGTLDVPDIVIDALYGSFEEDSEDAVYNVIPTPYDIASNDYRAAIQHVSFDIPDYWRDRVDAFASDDYLAVTAAGEPLYSNNNLTLPSLLYINVSQSYGYLDDGDDTDTNDGPSTSFLTPDGYIVRFGMHDFAQDWEYVLANEMLEDANWYPESTERAKTACDLCTGGMLHSQIYGVPDGENPPVELIQEEQRNFFSTMKLCHVSRFKSKAITLGNPSSVRTWK